jgi:hypothetical protein
MSDRQTSLTLEELRRELEAPQLGYPRCLIVNEIGVTCLMSEGKDGEETLLKLLESDDPSDRIIAFCFLSSILQLREKHASRLEAFRKEEANAGMIPRAEKMINAFISTTS